MVGFSIYQLRSMSLDELVQVAKADPSDKSRAMNEVVRHMETSAKVIANRVCLSKNDRPDVANAALYAVVGAVRGHDGRPVGLKSYLQITMEGAARRESLRLAKQSLVSEGDAFDLAVERDSMRRPDEIDEYDPEFYGEFAPIVRALSPAQQILVDELYQQDLRTNEIADRYGVTPSAISQRVKVLHRVIAESRGSAA